MRQLYSYTNDCDVQGSSHHPLTKVKTVAISMYIYGATVCDHLFIP